MATNVALFNPGAAVPSYAKGHEVSALTKALAGGGGNSGKRISIEGGVYKLMVDGKQVAAIEERYLDVVVVAAAPKVGRTYYGSEEYVKGKSTPPICWSSDGDLPAAEVKNKQCDKCVSCGQNEAGSGKGESKACRYSQQIAVVLANDIEGDVMKMSIPAKSLFGKEEGGNYPLQAYARYLAAQNVEANMVITRMKFDTTGDSSHPKLFFKAMRWLESDEYETAAKQGSTKEAIDAITMTVSAAEKVPQREAAVDNGFSESEDPPPPPPKSKAAAPAPSPQAPADEPPPPEPSKRKAASKEPPAVPTKDKLVDTLNKWDDE